MKICMPTEPNNGLSSKVCDHFGSAPFFTVYDTDNSALQTGCRGDRKSSMCVGNAVCVVG